VRFAAITLCVASQRVFVVVSTYVDIESVRKLLDTPSYVLPMQVCVLFSNAFSDTFLNTSLEEGNKNYF
jgi:hypothetical protein